MDKEMLEYIMKKQGVKPAALCEKIGISRTAFYRKMNGKSEFTHSELVKLIDVLNIADPMAIFFAK